MVVFIRRATMLLVALLLTTLLARPAPLSAQTVEAGVSGGVSAAGVVGEDDIGGTFGSVGLELCVFCTHRFAVFAEYGHLWRTSGLNEPGTAPICFSGNTFARCRPSGITSFDVVGGGLRIQRTRRRLRPFFDIGLGIGRDFFYPTSFVVDEPDWHAIGGVLWGTGAAIAVGERMYVRPQLRGFWMMGHVATTAGLAAGVRF